jgi:type IV pilus assembly protein PilB
MAKNTKIITIASGKGGVGKTNLCLNLALASTDNTRRICVLDADMGLANVDILLGLRPEHSLLDVLEGNCVLNEVLIDGPGSLKIIPGGSALERLPQLRGDERTRLKDVFRQLKDFDLLFIDAAAGISEQVLHLLEVAHVPILVLTPEPTSLTDAFSLLKSLQNGRREGPIYLLINQVTTADQAKKVFKKFDAAVKKFLHIAIKPIGCVPIDPKIPESVAKQTPFIELFPQTPASVTLKHIAKYLTSDGNGSGKPGEIETLAFLGMDSETQEEIEGLEVGKETRAEARPDPQTPSAGTEPQPTGDIVRLLAEEGRVSAHQIYYARRVQAKLDTPKDLLEILKALGYVGDSEIRETLLKNRTTIRLGSLLLELGYISEKQLALALNKQQQDGAVKRLGEVLVENNYISEYDLIQVLSMHLGYPYVEPNANTIDRFLLARATKNFFLKNHFLPLSQEDGAINIAMADPLDATALEEAKKLFGPGLNIFITEERRIREVIEQVETPARAEYSYETDDHRIVELVDGIIEDALKRQVSDIHMEPMRNRMRVRFRRDGALIHYMDLPKELEGEIVNRVKIMASANIAERRRHQDGRILLGPSQQGSDGDIRVSFYVTLFGEKIVMRILTKKAELFKIDDIGMAPHVLDRLREEVLEVPTGVAIITGPTGAGKTTTLYAAINYCNKMDTNIITAEEPVEYVIDGISQCSINPKIGLTFEESLRHILRQDPDTIVLGEIRDRFSAESAIQAALTGHKVLTTFHTEDSIGGLLRLLNMDIEAFLISSTVVSVVAQRLLKKVCPNCSEPYTPTSRDLRRLKYQPADLSGGRFQIGNGCSFCDFTGYHGRVGVFELLVLNEYVKDAILNRKTSYEIRRISIETTGLVTLLEDGLAKAARGITSIQEVLKQLPLLQPPRPLNQIYRLIGEVS